jgi:hypothetical protein
MDWKPKWRKHRVWIHRETSELVVTRFMYGVGWWRWVAYDSYAGIEPDEYHDLGSL